VNDLRQNGLPECWVELTLGEVAVDRTGTIDPRKYPDELFELYSVPSFPSGSPQVILGLDIGSHKQTVERETVLLCGINPRINRVWVVSGDTPYRKIASTEWIAFSPIEGVFPRYLSFYLQKDELRDYLASNASGVGGSLMRVKNATCSGFPFPLAPLREQKRIVGEIEKQSTRLEAAVAALERVKANMKCYRASVLKAACQGRLVPTEAELARAEGREYEPAEKLLARILKERRARWEADQLAKMHAVGKPPKDEKWKTKYKEPAGPDAPNLPKLPESWAWATVDQLLSSQPRSLQSGPFGSNLHHSEFVREGVLAIGIDNVLEGRFSLGREHRITKQKFAALAKYAARPLDVLVTVMATVGRCCVVPPTLEPAIVTKHVYRMTLNEGAIMPQYLVCCIRGGEPVREQLYGQVRGQTRPGLNGEILRTVAIPVPPAREQQRIVAEVERRLSVIDELEAVVEANLRRAERLRQAILKRAFEGKLVPQDPSDEPESVLLGRIKAAKSSGSTATPGCVAQPTTGKSACATGGTATPGCAGKRLNSKKAQAGVPVSQKTNP